MRDDQAIRQWSIAVHGGAGAMRNMSASKEAQYRAGLEEAVVAGAAVLVEGGSAVDACRTAVRAMESSGVFNAGIGSGLTRAGAVETDAAVMVAGDASIGAVGAVPNVGNAIELAEAVRVSSPHCLLVGTGAVEFARDRSVAVELCEASPERMQRYKELLGKETAKEASVRAEDLTKYGGTHDEGDTVGALALDSTGEIACAVSTGGIWMKAPGRVGDSPIPGSGFWAEDRIGAAVATGTGEFILRALMSSRAVDAMKVGADAQAAALEASDHLAQLFGEGKAGIATIDATGKAGFAFRTQGMGRASLASDMAEPSVGVWPGEEPN